MPRAADPVTAIHLEIEQLLDKHRRAGTAEAIVAEALARAVRASAVLVRASRLMSPTEGRRRL